MNVDDIDQARSDRVKQLYKMRKTDLINLYKQVTHVVWQADGFGGMRKDELINQILIAEGK